MSEDGSQDASIIQSVVSELSIYCKNSIKVVKSTVLPSILRELVEIDKNIIYNPEFLREKHANEDFINSEMLIFGGNTDISKKVSEAYKKYSSCRTTEHLFTDLETASLIKFSINTFLATKVIFFNELHSLFKGLNTDDTWEKFIKIISNDSRIGNSHMDVPGHDGKLGFGGACFPKDSLALVKYADIMGKELLTLKTVIKRIIRLDQAIQI